jgi:DNA-binding response OmpR family regulator
MDKILIVEDDRAVQKALKHLFVSTGYAVEVARDGRAGLESVALAPPAAVVLDLRLPEISGQEVCRQMKSALPTLPVVVLSACADVVDKVLLLEMGADDYITKPFSPRELLARVQASIRRATRLSAAPDVFAFDDVSINFNKMELTQAGQPVQLTAQEFKVLRFFIQNQDRVISREELLNEVWGYQSYPSTRTVDNHILRLRQKLEKDPSRPNHFKTMHGAGYKFIR